MTAQIALFDPATVPPAPALDLAPGPSVEHIPVLSELVALLERMERGEFTSPTPAAKRRRSKK